MTAVHLTPLFKLVREKIPPVYEIHVFIAAFQSVFVCGINNFRTFIHILENRDALRDASQTQSGYPFSPRDIVYKVARA